MRIIDITHDIANGMMLFPGDPEINIGSGLTFDKDYCHVDELHLNSHTGTHIDAPLHFIENGKAVTDYPAAKFMGKGVVVDLTGKKPGEPIYVSDIKNTVINEGEFVILMTGWSKYFGKELYLNHPYISKEAAEYLAAKGASIVGVDFLNVDRTLEEAWDAHAIFLENDILIVENLNNLDQLQPGRKYMFSFLPLKIIGTDGSPVRAVAVEEE